jgi:hypothetical protein
MNLTINPIFRLDRCFKEFFFRIELRINSLVCSGTNDESGTKAGTGT